MLCFFFFFTSSQREIKIIFQTFTTSGTSKPPVPHLFYFCFSFSTLPSPLSAFFRLCKWKGIEEKRALGSRSGNRAGGWGRKCPPRLHVPLWSAQVSRPEAQPNRTRWRREEAGARWPHAQNVGQRLARVAPQTD